MTLRDFQLARLIEYAAREVGPRGSLEEMKGIATCLRNRARAGWYDGNLLLVIEHADEHGAHEHSQETRLNPESRELARLLREIDDLYYASSDGEMTLESSLTEKDHEKKYWCYLDRPIQPRFAESILRDQAHHRSRTQLGTLMFLE